MNYFYFLITPVDILLSQKLFAVYNRPRLKGRDFFDLTFLLPKTKANMEYLKAKMGVHTPAEAKEKILDVCSGINFEDMVQDVQAFLFSAEDEKRIRKFETYFKQVEL